MELIWNHHSDFQSPSRNFNFDKGMSSLTMSCLMFTRITFKVFSLRFACVICYRIALWQSLSKSQLWYQGWRKQHENALIRGYATCIAKIRVRKPMWCFQNILEQSLLVRHTEGYVFFLRIKVGNFFQWFGEYTKPGKSVLILLLLVCSWVVMVGKSWNSAVMSLWKRHDLKGSQSIYLP